MDRANEAVFELMRECLTPFAGESTLPEADSELWPQIYRQLRAQDVFSLADKWLDAHPLSDRELLNEWKSNCFNIQLRTLQIMGGQEALLKLLAENSIAAVILKGSAAAYKYPQPFLRAMGDVDFLVKRADFERTCSLLEANGYKRDGEYPEGFHHVGYVKAGVKLELHRRLGAVPEDNESLLSLFEDGIDRRVEGRLGNFSFPMLPPELNGLVLLLHINQHLRVGLGLRQVIDWMFFVCDELDDGFYEASFRHLLASLGLETFAVTVTGLCERYLGLEAGRKWSAAADPEVCAELAEYIMDKGSFGRKSGKKGQVASVYLRAKNPFKLFGMLQRAGKHNWAAAKKHPILRPFAWAYQIKKTRSDLKKGNISTDEMKKLRSDGLRQRKLIESLGLDVDNKLHVGVKQSERVDGQ